MDAPADIRSHLRTDCEPGFALLWGSETRDGNLVGVLGVMEEMSHQVFSYWWDQVARLVLVFVFFGFGGHVGHLPNVDKVFEMELELIDDYRLYAHGMNKSRGWKSKTHLDKTNTLDRPKRQQPWPFASQAGVRPFQLAEQLLV